MVPMHYSLHLWFGTLLAGLGMIYGFIACFAMQRRGRNERALPIHTPAITVLRPLCGADPQLDECLRTCCDQDYPEFQIVFGVRDPHDPAIAVVRRLQHAFPHLDIVLAVDPRQHGTNRKVSNLINMLPHARHDHLVIADSDVRFPQDHLASLISPLLEPDVGIVTCVYRGTPRGGLWSVLGSLFINDWFIPSVRVAALSGSRAFAFGVTIAMRRRVLESIGGFDQIADQLADDYRLGELTRGQGLRTVLSDMVVETCVDERSLGELVRHELRWLRTIRAVQPLGYSLAGITFSLPVAILGALLAAGAKPALIMLGIAAVARVMLHFAGRGPGAGAGLSRIWAIPLSDWLGFVLWCWGFVSRRVCWRQDRYWIANDGSVLLIPDNEPHALGEPSP
jgi:ceramide glucosyltransferase